MNIFDQIAEAVQSIQHGWTSVTQAHMLASAIIALRPETSIEIGVFAGKGLVAMGLAHREIGKGMVYGIDPYSNEASADGQVNEADQKFWGTLDHASIYNMAVDNINKFGIQNSVRLIRKTSDNFTPPPNIGVLRIDGNHGEQVVKDVSRYCPNVNMGGILFLDDLQWAGGAVMRAAAKLRETGWKEICRLDTGLVMQKIR